MKKLILFLVVSAFALTMNAQVPSGYIDLGLPSGTLWEKTNESGLYTYAQAQSSFGRALPSEEDWQELKDNCQWVWTGNGCRVIGPNRNVLFLPAAGYIKCSGNSKHENVAGHYMSGDSVDEYQIWGLLFAEGQVGTEVVVDVVRKCEALSVRLTY